MSNGVFQENGSSYPFTSLSKDQFLVIQFTANSDAVYTDASGTQHVNETKYEEVGLAYSGAQYTWEIFMVSFRCRFPVPSTLIGHSGTPRTSRPLSGVVFS